LVNITSAATLNEPQINFKNDLISFVGVTTIRCSTYSNQKEWTIYQMINTNQQQQIFLKNNPTINYADLVLQPQTLSYGVYKIVFTVKMANTIFSASAFTFIRIIPSGLVLSSLSLSQPMYGGTIEITRGQNQTIKFNPYRFTYDIDNVAVITSLTFKYSCQIIDSNAQQGYPLKPGTNQTIYLDEFKSNPSYSQVNSCFNSTGNKLFNMEYKRLLYTIVLIFSL
jgi:hypothetical protein